jgi:hypothetical protein
MGIDYVIDLDCAPKQTLGIEEIVNMIKAQSRAEMVLGVARQNGDQRPPAEVTFKVALNRNGNIETTDVSVQQLFDQATGLEAHRASCASCPANRDNPNGFGCYDSVPYPLEPDTEQFLLGRLPDKLEGPSGYMFTSALTDFAWEGAQAADMRSQGETFFRAREPFTRSWPGVTVTSDQVFHMMFHVGHLQSSHAMMLCMFFGLLDMGTDDPRTSAVVPESTNSHRMIDFLNTLAFAASQKLDVLVDG